MLGCPYLWSSRLHEAKQLLQSGSLTEINILLQGVIRVSNTAQKGDFFFQVQLLIMGKNAPADMLWPQ